MIQKFLGWDAETGGFYADQHSLLTLYMGSFIYESGRFVLKRDLDLKIKPNDDDPYKVTAGALAVNKIDLVKHHKEAISIDEAASKVYYFLKEESDNGGNKLMRVGHNEPFDKGFVVAQVIKESILRLFTDYHTLDTVPIAKYLQFKGKIPSDVRLKLEALAKFFGVTYSEGSAHTAKGDVHVMMRVLETMMRVLETMISL